MQHKSNGLEQFAKLNFVQSSKKIRKKSLQMGYALHHIITTYITQLFRKD